MADSERLVYVLAPGADDGAGTIDLLALWKVIWQSRLLIAAFVFICVALSVGYALLAKQWFTAEVLLAPARASSTQNAVGTLAGRLGGLASLAGVTVGGGDSAEPLAVLTSRELTSAFIADRNLLPVLFADDWDAEKGQWKISDPKDWPDIRDAVKLFAESIRTVSENTRTGLVTMTIEWTDPEVAAQWANELVDRLNARMRDRALADATRNLEYLRSELDEISVVTLQQSIGALIETELQKLMLARGNEEFSFRVIDHAQPPKRRSSPNRKLIVAFAFLASAMVAVSFVLLRHSLRPAKPNVDRGA